MQLDRVEILGFRGIKRLSLSFDEVTTLLGENTWGKSSLLDALCIALPINGQLHQFEIEDFHVDYVLSQPQTEQIQIITRWRTTTDNEHRNPRYRRLKPIWLDDSDTNTSNNKAKMFIYQISASRVEHKVETIYQFLDAQGQPMLIHDSDKLVIELSRIHPVIRLRDARRLHQYNGHTNQHYSKTQASDNKAEKRINNTYRRLLAMPGHVNKAELKSTLNAMQHLIEHYFSFQEHPNIHARQQREHLFSAEHHSPDDQTSLLNLLKKNKNQQSKLLLMGLLNAYLQAKGSSQISAMARPILILEDPEGRLHPTNLLKSWELLQLIPMQKILTTNSGILLSAVPLSSIRRLVRQSDKTAAFAIHDHLLNKDDLRRIGFHIRFHRPNALFARCWLLVEGETEVWLFNELAKIYGYNLAAEGVQLVEFAQSGLKSLIKVAKALHIDWHVVVDGDPAGQKYAAAVRSQLDQDIEKHRLTELPDRDIEHFLYNNGFEEFFRSMVHITANHPISDKKIVQRAVKKHAKPDLALGIVEYCEAHGIEKIPLLLRWILKRVLTMANGNT
ncbi:DUF2813 domain-containing protein [Vibrio rumoiensis]|uniref:ATP-dependent endonuclease n=1 Tax=Vibrio rumoiensis 1S-45 TaxID=1188252 RepID=A0A1E5DZI4_9VIBR|nr:DUF2813 domain-containing protein [Vibrio rumoiensis]OEF23262.1 ATP-dependent endonuclease [Vibrio rumoiensis 1S-45]